jgi:hypothetical protein
VKGAIAVEAGDTVVLNDDRCRRLLVGAAMVCRCLCYPRSLVES